MTDTVKIMDKQKRMTVTVKSSFLETCPTPSNHTVPELIKDFNLLTFIHNEHGPAIVQHWGDAPCDHIEKLVAENKQVVLMTPEGRVEYWIEGACLNRKDPEQAKRMHHSVTFNHKLEEIIKD